MAYSKTNWVNGQTPINQSNLNKIEDELETLDKEGIIVSPTEPTTDRRKVWMKKGKNLLDKNRLNNLFMPASSTSEELEYNKQAYTTNWIECMPNTKYIISGQNRVRWQLKSSSGIITHIEAGTITTASDTKYIRCYCYYDENNTGIDNLNLQIEQNATVTSYEAYIEPSTYIKNDNGVYESLSKDKPNNSLLNLNMSYFDTVDNNKVVKTGHVVTVYFRAHTSSNIPNGTIIATFPYTSIINPIVPIYSGGRYNLTDPIFSFLESNTKNWKISTTSADKWLQASFTYITSD